MRKTYTLLLHSIYLTLLMNCDVNEMNKSENKTDTTITIKNANTVLKINDSTPSSLFIYDKSQLDSIQNHLIHKGIKNATKWWEMLTKKDGNLVVNIPSFGDNNRFLLLNDSVFILRFIESQSAMDYLIIDYTFEDQFIQYKCIISNLKSNDGELNNKEFYFHIMDLDNGIINCGLIPNQKPSTFVDSVFMKKYPKIEATNTYE